LECADWGAPGGIDGERGASHQPRWIALLYRFPERSVLRITDKRRIVLSREAQQYLAITAASEYAASRHVIIVAEAHHDLSAQFALFKGLEVFFDDNPCLVEKDGTAFLAEGYPAGKPLSVQPLVAVDSHPSDDSVHDALSTFLIPGYVAYEWKHQQGIPILGNEDPELHRISASTLVKSCLPTPEGTLASTAHMLSVPARNQSMAETLLTQLDRYECPILFTGYGHVGYDGLDSGSLSPSPLASGSTFSDRVWQSLDAVAQSSDVERLRLADPRLIYEYLKENKIGFYCLKARGDVFRDDEVSSRQWQRYLDLFRAQLNDDVGTYVAKLAGTTDACTVAPSTEDAAKYMAAKKKGGKKAGGKKAGGKKAGGKKGGGKKGGKKGGGKKGGADDEYFEVIDSETGEVKRIPKNPKDETPFLSEKSRRRKVIFGLLGELFGGLAK